MADAKGVTFIFMQPARGPFGGGRGLCGASVTEETISQRRLLCAYLSTRRESILKAWRERAAADPVQTTVSALTRLQFDNHIPQLLDAFDRKLRAPRGTATAAAAGDAQTEEDIKHGLLRWQQGYRLEEVMHEWGHLHLCLCREVEAFGAQHPEISRATMATVHEELIQLISGGVNESASQYARMQQAEAADRLRDLERAVAEQSAVERRRGNLLHQAVHDLRTNVQSVTSAADVLEEAGIPEHERVEFTRLVRNGVGSVAMMLGELMALARLEAGQESRQIAPFDAAQLLHELCASVRPIAVSHHLYLDDNGPTQLPVEGDQGKIRRILQNLITNSLKYTTEGGVRVRWGEEPRHWWVMVVDTGPGLAPGPAALLLAGLKQATSFSREGQPPRETRNGGKESAASAVFPARPEGAPPPGEGIGLSIVKRLCELLDATLEVDTTSAGTSFRVVFPKHYTNGA